MNKEYKELTDDLKKIEENKGTETKITEDKIKECLYNHTFTGKELLDMRDTIKARNYIPGILGSSDEPWLNYVLDMILSE